jgi:RNA 2',3'-cyclic 3'-phosphodiesterase
VDGVSKPATDNKRVRMFIALDLPETVRKDIATWGEAELSDPALRRVPPESLHVTLAFLGDRPLRDVEPIAEVIAWAAEHPVSMELGDPVGSPPGDRPRLIALPVLGEPVEKLEENLGRILIFEGLHLSESHHFWPHVTVARVRNEGGGSRRPMPVEVPSVPAPTARTGWFDGVRISLYRSELQLSGARYVPLAQVQLPGRGWQ